MKLLNAGRKEPIPSQRQNNSGRDGEPTGRTATHQRQWHSLDPRATGATGPTRRRSWGPFQPVHRAVAVRITPVRLAAFGGAAEVVCHVAEEGADHKRADPHLNHDHHQNDDGEPGPQQSSNVARSQSCSGNCRILRAPAVVAEDDESHDGGDAAGQDQQRHQGRRSARPEKSSSWSTSFLPTRIAPPVAGFRSSVETS